MIRYLTSSFLILSLAATSVLGGEEKPGYLGARVWDPYKEELTEGTTVMLVFANSPAKSSGLIEGDVILQVNNIKTPTAQAYRDQLSRLNAGTKVRLRVKRGVGEINLSTVLTDRPKPSDLLWQKNPPRAPGGTIIAGGSFIGGIINGGSFIVNGTPTVKGDYTQLWFGLFGVIIKDHERAKARISGNVSLDGILHVFFDGVTPKKGDSFELISGAATLKGRFTEIMLPPTAKGLRWELIYDDVVNGKDLDHDGKHDLTLTLISEPVAIPATEAPSQRIVRCGRLAHWAKRSRARGVRRRCRFVCVPKHD